MTQKNLGNGRKRASAAGSGSGNRGGIERIKRLIRAQGQRLLSLPNVTSVGIGFKQVGGISTDVVALQFSVERKLAPESLSTESISGIPGSIAFEGVDIPTDVVQRAFKPGYMALQLQPKSDRKSRQDPIRGGISVGHIKSTAGTIGAIVLDSASRAPVILSNWHVLNGADGRPGDAIVQPGPFDDNQVEKNHVGVLLRSHLGLAGDCAIASIENRRTNDELFDLPAKIDSVGKPELGDLVIKSGRTTGVTYGQVSRIEALFKIPYQGIGEQTVGGFEIEPSKQHPAPENEISKGGDSGSTWLAVNPADGKVTGTILGLHFGGDAEGSDGEFALACYAHSVFQKLEIEPYSGSATRVETERHAADNALRKGFDQRFLDFEIANPGFSNKVRKDLRGLVANGAINYCHFSVWLAGQRKLPVCVAWNVDGGRKKSLSRKGIRFVKDDRNGLDEYQIGDELYVNNDLDRGHVARRDDLVWGDAAEAKQANLDSFFFTNMTPQHKAFNQSQLQGKWGLLENAILDEVVVKDLRVSLMGGPILESDDIAYRGVQIPDEFWKVVFFTDDEDGEHKARAFVLTQKDLLKEFQPEALGLQDFRWWQVPLVHIEERTGVRFAVELHRVDTKFPQGVGVQARLVDGGEFFSA